MYLAKNITLVNIFLRMGLPYKQIQIKKNEIKIEIVIFFIIFAPDLYRYLLTKN